MLGGGHQYQIVPSVKHPRGCLQNFYDGFGPHTGDDDVLRLTGGQDLQAAAEPELHPFPVRRAGHAGLLQRVGAQVASQNKRAATAARQCGA